MSSTLLGISTQLVILYPLQKQNLEQLALTYVLTISPPRFTLPDRLPVWEQICCFLLVHGQLMQIMTTSRIPMAVCGWNLTVLSPRSMISPLLA